MARPYWNGHIQISLVSFGVKLFVATEAKSEIRFHQISRSTGERVRHQKVLASAIETAPDEAADPVAKNEIVKGFEYRKGEYITIEPSELEHLRVPSKHTMEVAQFVDEDDIAPEYYEKPYFVVPENDVQAEAFATVRAALIDTKKVALSKIAFGGREHIVALHAAGSDQHPGMMAYTMRYAAELRDPRDYFGDVKGVKVDADSLALAKELIRRKAAKFDPEKFVDGYEVALKELVDAKLKHTPIPKDEEVKPKRGQVINLMDALRKSVSGKAGDSESAPSKRPVAKAHASDKKSGAAKGLSLVKSSPRAEAKHESKHPHAARHAPKRKSA
jgi:DNA end-binding protein Ku